MTTTVTIQSWSDLSVGIYSKNFEWEIPVDLRELSTDERIALKKKIAQLFEFMDGEAPDNILFSDEFEDDHPAQTQEEEWSQ